MGEGREANNCLYGIKEGAATGEFLPKKPNPKAVTCFIRSLIQTLPGNHKWLLITLAATWIYPYT